MIPAMGGLDDHGYDRLHHAEHGRPEARRRSKTDKFSDVQHFPVMKFSSKRIEQTAAGKLKVSGDLTINAITREVVLTGEGPSSPIHDKPGKRKGRCQRVHNH